MHFENVVSKEFLIVNLEKDLKVIKGRELIKVLLSFDIV